MSLKEHLYLWCHNAGVYNNILPYQSQATPVEAAEYLGIENIIMVCYGGRPVPPFAPLHKEFGHLKKVVWSLIGDAACKYDSPLAYVDEVLSLARDNTNVTGGIMDDFFHAGRFFDLNAISGKMRAAGLPLWVVLYDQQLGQESVMKQLELCDVITFWTWDVTNLAGMESNLTELRRAFPHKKIVAGCYLWNFGGKAPLTVHHQQYQCLAAQELLEKQVINDIIILGSPLVGMPLDTIEWTRRWIRDND